MSELRYSCGRKPNRLFFGSFALLKRKNTSPHSSLKIKRAPGVFHVVNGVLFECAFAAGEE